MRTATIIIRDEVNVKIEGLELDARRALVNLPLKIILVQCLLGKIFYYVRKGHFPIGVPALVPFVYPIQKFWCIHFGC